MSRLVPKTMFSGFGRKVSLAASPNRRSSSPSVKETHDGVMQ